MVASVSINFTRLSGDAPGQVVPLIPAMLTRTLTRVFLIIRLSRLNKGIPSLN